MGCIVLIAMEDNNADLTWTPEDAQGDEFGKDAKCPYWRCSEQVTFVGEMGRDDDGNIMDVRYTCEQCGRTHQWAQEAKDAAVRADKRNSMSFKQLHALGQNHKER